MPEPLKIDTKIAGVFNIPEGKTAMKLLEIGQRIDFEAEPQNAFDKNAIALFANDNSGLKTKIGYLPKTVAADLVGKTLLRVEKSGPSFDSIIAFYVPAEEVKATASDVFVLTDQEINHFRLIQSKCHAIAVAGGWWNDIKTGEPLKRNKGELLMLMVSELAEAMEGERKNLMDDKLPHRRMAEVELADAIIRIMDYAGAHGYDVAGAMDEKLGYNTQRPDHKPENRAKEDGKKF